MKCTNCGSENEVGSRFCLNCGQSLTASTGQPKTGVGTLLKIYERRLLALASGRLVIILLLLWLFRSILINLSFIKSLQFPDIPFTAVELVTLITYLAILGLLVNYVQTLRSQWPRAFPSLQAVVPVMTAIFYVVILSLIYSALIPILAQLIDDPGDFILILRTALLILSVALFGWGVWVIYQALPGWLSTIRLNMPDGKQEIVVCLKCGRLNEANSENCHACGNSLTGQSSSEAAQAR